MGKLVGEESSSLVKKNSVCRSEALKLATSEEQREVLALVKQKIQGFDSGGYSGAGHLDSFEAEQEEQAQKTFTLPPQSQQTAQNR